MDRSLDEVIAGRQQNQRGQRGPRGRRPNGYPRDGVRKTNQFDSRDLDQDWVHDRYDDDDDVGRPRRGGNRPERANRSPVGRAAREDPGYKLKVENVHYDINEDDIRELFSRLGPLKSASIVYDRQDRSTGIAYVSYVHLEDAMKALNDYNGQKACDQPIYLTMLPNKDGSAGAAPRRNPFDSADRPSRSLFDRIENPSASRRGRGRDRRSLSPEEPVRHSDVRKPPPDHIDRYVPGQRDDSRRRSPPRRSTGATRGGQPRRPGARREQGRRDDQGRPTNQGRPRKTQEELDAEMEDYWNQDESQQQQASGRAAGGKAPANGAAAQVGDDDIDMIE